MSAPSISGLFPSNLTASWLPCLQWKATVAAQMAALQERMQAQQGLVQRTDHTSVQRELHTVKNALSAQSSHVDQQIASLRASLVRLEGDMALLTSDVKLTLQKTAHTADALDRRALDLRADLKRQIAQCADASSFDRLRFETLETCLDRAHVVLTV